MNISNKKNHIKILEEKKNLNGIGEDLIGELENKISLSNEQIKILKSAKKFLKLQIKDIEENSQQNKIIEICSDSDADNKIIYDFFFDKFDEEITLE